MKTLLIGAILILTACGKIPTIREGQVDAEFTPFINMFLKKAYENGKSVDQGLINKLNASFDDNVVYPTVGLCSFSSRGELSITINPSNWNSTSISAREQLMFHELGHCILGLKHDERYVSMENAKCPIGFTCMPYNYGHVSIMHPYTMDIGSYESNRDYYIQQLFNSLTSIPNPMYYNSVSQFDIHDYIN